MGHQHFRANVVAIVVDSTDRVLAFERGDIADQWQLPQGGVDDDETPRAAAWRELEEETGLGKRDVRLIDEFPEWTAYAYPEGAKKHGRLGQAQRWFTFQVLDDSVEPQPDGDEFVAWKWVERDWLVDHAVDFRQASYRRVLLEPR